MRRLGISQKVLLLLSSLVLLTLSMGFIIYLSMQDFDSTREKLETLHNFQMQIHILQQYHHDPTSHATHPEKDDISLAIENAQTLVRQIQNFHLDMKHPDKGDEVYSLLKYYSKAALEFGEHNKEYTKLIKANTAIIKEFLLGTAEFSPEEQNKALYFFSALNNLREESSILNLAFDSEKFHRLKEERDQSYFGNYTKIDSLIDVFFLNHEKIFIEDLAIKSSLDYLQKSNDRFLLEAEEDIGLLAHQSHLQQKKLRHRILLLGSLILLLACIVGFMTSLRLNKFLSTMKDSISNIQSGNYDYEVNYAPNDESGDLIRFVKSMAMGLKKEIQERREAEEQLQQAQKMEAIGTLAGGIAHDFNNLLTGIDGYAQLIELDAGNKSLVMDYIAKLRKGNSRASDLVKQILTFSRKTTNAQRPLSIAPIIKEVTKLLQASLPKNIRISATTKTNAKVLADPSQIHQVIMNLCTNAYHAMREQGGKLDIHLDETVITQVASAPDRGNAPPGHYLYLKISDTGKGIEDSNLPRIFEPYFTTKPAGEGTGLGLSVVHGIIKANKGHIQVTSQIQQGTTFHLYLPVYKEANDQKDESEKEDNLPGGTEKVMLVDDEVDICRTTKGLLTKHGYQVQTFTNGVEALQQFQRDPAHFDILITDISMPYMNGALLAQKITEIRPDLPIILCTGYSDTITEERAAELGFTAYLEKPVRLAKLLKTIRTQLDNASLPRP